MKMKYVSVGVIIGILMTAVALGFMPGVKTQEVQANTTAGVWMMVTGRLDTSRDMLWLFDTQQKNVFGYYYDMNARAMVMLAGRKIDGDTQVINQLKCFPIPKKRKFPARNIEVNPTVKDFFSPSEVAAVIAHFERLTGGR